jgi:hypothetical protein
LARMTLKVASADLLSGEPGKRSRAVLIVAKSKRYQGDVAKLATSDPSAHVRKIATAMLNSEAVGALITCLDDEDDDVVMAACAVLSGSSSDLIVDPLRRVAALRSARVRFYACNALCSVGHMDQVTLQGLKALALTPEGLDLDASVRSQREVDAKYYPNSGVSTLTTAEMIARTESDAGSL